MNRNTQMRNDRAPVNQQVKLLVKAKRQKFISTQFPCMHVHQEELSKQAHSRDKRRRENNVHKKPVWQTWGTTDYHQQNGIGLFGNEEVFGNHLSGQQWVEQQKRRQKQFIVQPGQIKSIAKQNAQQTQYTYIQPATPEQKLDFLRKRGYQFEDCDFPPNNNSLNGQYGIDSQWEVIQWKRIRFMIPNATIFQGKVQPTDIKQGYLGDCYFLAGLAALAERPDRIFNLFLLKQRNQLSFFSVKILYKGKWRMVDLDDSVPFVFSTPAFSRTVNGELWVVLLEKAWAKIYGSYKNIQAGFPEQPLHDLTGAPIKQIYLTHKSYKTDEQWKYLIEASLKQYAMVASSNTDGEQHISKTGIFRAHAYTFLNAIQIETRSGKQRVVQLRNTWGRGQFKGKWADDHPIWDQVSQQDKYRVRYKKDVEDGIFFMEFDDFTKEFRIITVAEISDNSSYVYQSSYDPDKKGVYFTLKILQQANYCLQVDKTPERSLSLQKQKSYRYPQSMLEIGRINETSSQMLQGCSERRKTMFKTHKLFPGQYVVYVKINFDSKYQQDFDVTLAVYSDFSCGITISTQQEVFKLTGKKNEWDGIKKTKPAKPVLPFEVRSTTFIETKQSKNSKLTSIQGQEQVENHKQQQIVKKSYRNQTEFERKNPLIMFGFHNIIAEQTPCYKHAVGELQQHWNSKQKDKRKSNSKSKQKSKVITTTTNLNLESATVHTNLIVNQLGKKAEELRSKSRESHITQNVKVVETKGKQLVEKQKKITVVHKQVNKTVDLGYKQEHFDSRSYKLVKKEQKTVRLVEQIRKDGEIETQKKQTIKQEQYRTRENIENSLQIGIGVKIQQKSQYSRQQQTNKDVKQTKKVNKTQTGIKQMNTEQVTTSTIRVNTIQTDSLIRNEQKQTQTQESTKMTKQVKGTYIQKQNQNIQSVYVKNGKQDKMKSRPYAEDIIQNVLGFNTSYREEHQQGGKQHLVRKQVRVTVSRKMQTNKTVQFTQSTIEKTKITEKIPEHVAVQDKQKKQTKQMNLNSKLKVETQYDKKQGKEVKKIEKEKNNNESEEYQKEVRDSLKKRRRNKDILKYPSQNTQHIVNNIIFDLWPKIKY